jgi:hypothetical protein
MLPIDCSFGQSALIIRDFEVSMALNTLRRANQRHFMRTILRGALAGTGLLLGGAGCAEQVASFNCTDVGCSNGLTVRLSSMPVGPFTVEALIGGRTELQYVYRCDGAVGCQQARVFFEGLVTSRVTIRVTTAQGVRIVEFPDVIYTEWYPNGRECTPRCVTATVTLDLPA